MRIEIEISTKPKCKTITEVYDETGRSTAHICNCINNNTLDYGVVAEKRVIVINDKYNDFVERCISLDELKSLKK